jgi:hypothetical protein
MRERRELAAKNDRLARHRVKKEALRPLALKVLDALSVKRSGIDVIRMRPLERVRLLALLNLNMKPSDIQHTVSQQILSSAGLTSDLLRQGQRTPEHQLVCLALLDVLDTRRGRAKMLYHERPFA